MAEKGGARFSVRLIVTGRQLEAAQLQTIAAPATRFGDGSVHLTTRQGVEIPRVAFGNLDSLRAALEQAGLAIAAAGKSVRGIIACLGSYCLRGLIDSQGLARRLHACIETRTGLPHRFKIGIAGCTNGLVPNFSAVPAATSHLRHRVDLHAMST